MQRTNGVQNPPEQAAGPEGDPLLRVMAIKPRIPVAVTVALAISLHAGMAAGATAAAIFGELLQWNRELHAAVASQIDLTYNVDVVKETPPPPPEPEPAKEEPKEEPRIKDTKAEDPPPPPPEAAQAGKVLTQEPDPNEPVDLTGNGFVTGNGDTFAGGTTQQGGTSKTAVRNAAAVATGAPGGTGIAPAPAAPKVDRSRGARVGNMASLERCPFPAEADAEQIDEATVGIEVRVRADGTAESVVITGDPGHGFGREAKKCAMRERYTNALDVDGNAIAATAKIRFNFRR